MRDADQPTTTQLVISILVEVLSGTLIVILFYILYMHFIGPNRASKDVSVVRPQDISEELKKLPKQVTTYMFWGRSGSFFRSYPIIELDKDARNKKHNISIDVLLPNPEEKHLVDSYQDILVSLGEEEGENTLLSHVVATCLICAILDANNRYLNVRIHISSFLPGFRLDLSDNGAILTQDDKRKSALFFESGSEFYEMFRSTMLNECKISRRIIWDETLFRDLDLDRSSCTVLTIDAFNIEVPDVSSIQTKVANLVARRPHRYK
ncbi:MAG: hypothetical protein F4Y62_03530 [Rhodospirillaceae bacterium]|nr:hypothetical protein [Rhodospirillaceae bacterium]